jgi:uncharacterized protein YeaO (DUF488 family)
MPVRIKRIYDDPQADDGDRILVDRVWPRGCTKEQARLDEWMKDVAPSTELRRWFAHKPERWAQFRERYLLELKGNAAVNDLRERSATRTVTLLYGARDRKLNQAVVLAELLSDPS